MSNFVFLPAEFGAIAESTTNAEGHILDDSRAARFTLVCLSRSLADAGTRL
jgi:hypothetical protein